jgi:threonylcarbamoyladenosine tRNA methylthiotransferase MtaB
MKTFIIKTIGCKANQYDTELIRGHLVRNGYREHAGDGEADLCIVNTCTVTGMSDLKSRRAVVRLIRRYPRARHLVTGCGGERVPDFFRSVPGVTHVTGNRDKETLGGMLGDGGERARRGIATFEGHHRAFVKVQDGCDAFCSYCVVPYVRGAPRSRPIADVLREVSGLAQNGYGEVVLTGIHLGIYGRDLGLPGALPELIKRLHEIPALKRIRLSSIQPGEVTGALIELLGSAGKLCRHLHMPLQSGDDRVLAAMRRRYTRRDYIRLVEKLRNAVPDVSLTTDIMVGFPCEDRAAFERTLDLVGEAVFSRIHAFPYSPRPGTAAYGYGDPVPRGEKEERRLQLVHAAEETAVRYRRLFPGKVLEVLFQGRDAIAPGMSYGISREYLKVYVRRDGLPAGCILPVRITSLAKGGLFGSLEEGRVTGCGGEKPGDAALTEHCYRK